MQQVCGWTWVQKPLNKHLSRRAGDPLARVNACVDHQHRPHDVSVGGSRSVSQGRTQRDPHRPDWPPLIAIANAEYSCCTRMRRRHPRHPRVNFVQIMEFSVPLIAIWNRRRCALSITILASKVVQQTSASIHIVLTVCPQSWLDATHERVASAE